MPDRQESDAPLTRPQTLAMLTAHPDTWELAAEVPMSVCLELWRLYLVDETPLTRWKMTPRGYEVWRVMREG